MAHWDDSGTAVGYEEHDKPKLISHISQLTQSISIKAYTRGVVIIEDTHPKPREIFLMHHDIKALIPALTEYINRAE